MFAQISGAEERLGEKAQAAISKLPIGHAAELMETVVSKGEAIKNPDRYVTAAVNRWEKAAADEKTAADEKATADEKTAADENAQANISIGNQYQVEDEDDDDNDEEAAREVEGGDVQDPSPGADGGDEDYGGCWGGEGEGWGWQHEPQWEEDTAYGDDYWRGTAG